MMEIESWWFLEEIELELDAANLHISIKKLCTGNKLIWVVAEAHNEFRSIGECLPL